MVKAANDAESKRRQADAVNKLVDAGLAQNQAEAGALIARAVSAAAERAEEVQTILGAWSDAPGDMRKTDANAALLERVRDSKTLRDISRYLGRFREIFAQGKRNGYAYGRGEKYALELGNDLSRALTSELAMLAVPETLPLFLRKYQHRQIKQYRRREPVYKGAGDIICCLDESGSTAGDLAAWGKAVALTLLEIAQSERRKFALVHFLKRSCTRRKPSWAAARIFKRRLRRRNALCGRAALKMLTSRLLRTVSVHCQKPVWRCCKRRNQSFASPSQGFCWMRETPAWISV